MSLNPAQSEVLALLGAVPAERPSFDAELRHELRALLESGIVPALDAAGPEPVTELRLSKHDLTSVLGCERRSIGERDAGFVVTPPLARGTVVHKAVELTLNWRGEVHPADLVDEALARLEYSDGWLTEFLQTTDEGTRAELRALAVERVSQFLECWPPLEARWRPVTESSLLVELADGRLVLRGKVDLTLGRPDGLVAGKVLVDFKTGRHRAHHLDDLRFYALLETMRLGVPPRRMATYYLDQGSFVPEDVTEATLEAAARRVVAAARRRIELDSGSRPPTTAPSGACRWCPVREGCAEGRAHLAASDETPGLDGLTDWD